ncbi:alginate export family protein [Oceanicaulis sp. LC35]|uniref:alginate export family protein n=1 Tax=Oceanicaulis sp. LC35 TaxID=3349635 RepID=UPI003F869FF8
MDLVRLAASSLAMTAAEPLPAEAGWRLSASGSFRARYETLSNQFREGGSGGDQSLALRTFLSGEATRPGWTLAVELADSRVYGNDSGSSLSTSHVNTLEVLQAHVRADLQSLMGLERPAELTMGRMTIDLGGERLVDRNSFRNTRNAFTGARLIAEIGEGAELVAFWTVPVERRPSDAARLLENDHAFDEENWDQQFWAISLTRQFEASDLSAEVYLYGLSEQDAARRPTADRALYTPGLRLLREPARRRWDFEIEHAFQFGERSVSSAAGAQSLDVSAQTHHAALGYTFDAPWRPRLSLEYEYASGEELGDGDWSRFDPLYGGRRGDFGHTSIHGPLRRQNISAPGVRLSVKEGPTDALFLVKGAFLASDTDAWAGSGVVDRTGQSGDYIGTHVSGRVRHWLVEDRLQLELGGAVLFQGEFAERAPNTPDNGDTVYGYIQTKFSF